MTCEEARELAAAHALSALEPGEARALERHLADPGPHQGCLEAVARAQETALSLAAALAVREAQPEPGLWRAIEARTGEAPGRPWATRRSWPAWAAAVAAVVGLSLAGRAGLELRRERAAAGLAAAERDRAQAELAALRAEGALQAEALALLDRPGARVVALEPQPGQAGRAVAIVDLAGGRALVASRSLPARAGKDYQLWVIRGAGPPRPAGFLRPAGQASAGEIDPALLRGAPPDALAVSLEPAGGSPAPTQVVLVGKVSG
jgi:anti-sigma-K factor RskA